MPTIVTNEPTHTVDGVVKPGPADLRATVDPTKVSDADAVSADFYAGAPNRTRQSALHPHILDPHAPLQALTFDAIREYGEMNPGSMEGDVAPLFVGFANKIIEDMRSHPYFEMPDLDYYKDINESRPIPDILVKIGLQYYYALQQSSEKVKLKAPEYFSRLNTVMYNRRYGNGPIEINPRK